MTDALQLVPGNVAVRLVLVAPQGTNKFPVIVFTPGTIAAELVSVIGPEIDNVPDVVEITFNVTAYTH